MQIKSKTIKCMRNDVCNNREIDKDTHDILDSLKYFTFKENDVEYVMSFISC